MAARVPRPDEPHVRDFCRTIAPGQRPIRVEPRPRPDAPKDVCFHEVRAFVGRKGGSMLCEWAVWEQDGLYLEAEFHCLWKQPGGTLRDVSPLPGDVRSRHQFFLPDPSRSYEGKRVNNRRQPLVEHLALIEYLDALDDRFEVDNRGELAFQTGRVRPDPAEHHRVMGRVLAAEMGLIKAGLLDLQ